MTFLTKIAPINRNSHKNKCKPAPNMPAIERISNGQFQPQLFLFLWKLLVFVFIFLNLYILFGERALPPDGTQFHLLMLFIVSHFGAKIARFCHLPHMIGMLIAGIV